MTEQKLEIEEDLLFQKREWLIQRIGWTLMLLVMCSALLGVFGSGPVSKTVINQSDKLSLEYERFARYESPTSLKIKVNSPGENNEAHIWISRNYLDDVKIERIVPEPQNVRAEGEWLVYVFKRGAPGDLVVKLDFTTQVFGRVSGVVASQGVQLTINQFIYP
jgi:hypothetical protein